MKEAGEGGFQGAIIIYQKAGGNPTNNPPTGATGLYIFTATAGSWTVTLNVPNGYESSDGITQRTLNVASNLSDINFGIIAAATPTPTTVSYNASGFVFYDYNSNQTFNKNATIPEKCLDIPVTINFCGVAHVFDPADSNWATDPSSGCKIYSYSCSSGNSCETVIIQSLPTGYFTTGWNGSDATRQNISGMTGASAYVCNE
ncbi:MAG: hypothetical protein A2W22_01355 [Candidatus Levybacteria bacterium RBG_16_35_11]|nr:MAG: hypothetical protein A2W22_01355 [Candidatus Levybacteria bacterium RBG_16_35_11]